MRREMQEILPGVWLGPYAAAMKRNVSFCFESLEFQVESADSSCGFDSPFKSGTAVEPNWHYSYYFDSWP